MEIVTGKVKSEGGVLLVCPDCKTKVILEWAKDNRLVRGVSDRFEMDWYLDCPACKKSFSLPSSIGRIFAEMRV